MNSMLLRAFGVLLITFQVVASQEIRKVSVRTDINTTEGDAALSFTIDLDSNSFGKSLILDTVQYKSLSVRETSTDRVLASQTQLEVITSKRNIKIKIPITKETKPLIEILMNENAVYLDAQDDMKVITKSQDSLNTHDTIVITPAEIRSVSIRIPVITTKQRNELVEAYGGYQALLGRKIEAGWRLGEADSLNVTKYLSFNFISELLPGTLSEFGGLISTKMNDAASRIRFTPMIYKISKEYSTYVKASYEVSQSGNDQRVYGSLFYQGLIGNLVDLTSGYSRLRLFPIITAGIDGQYYLESTDTTLLKTFFFEPFIQMYYYIPVFDRYNIIFDGGVQWRSDPNRNLIRKDVRAYGEVSLGYEPPGAGIVVLAKYTFGTNELTYQKDNKIMIEALIDFFKKQ